MLAKENKNLKLKEESDCSVQRLEFLLKEALDEDEEGDMDEALPLYLEAIETGLKAVEYSNIFICSIVSFF